MTYPTLQTLFFCDFDNINNREETINDELIKLTEWLGCNQLSLNEIKLNLCYSILTEKLLITQPFNK